jgi:hypothetical protein
MGLGGRQLWRKTPWWGSSYSELRSPWRNFGFVTRQKHYSVESYIDRLSTYHTFLLGRYTQNKVQV